MVVIELVEERGWMFCLEFGCPRLFSDGCTGATCPHWVPGTIIAFHACIGLAEGFVGATVTAK